jgi:hypothetical protein
LALRVQNTATFVQNLDHNVRAFFTKTPFLPKVGKNRRKLCDPRLVRLG